MDDFTECRRYWPMEPNPHRFRRKPFLYTVFPTNGTRIFPRLGAARGFCVRMHLANVVLGSHHDWTIRSQILTMRFSSGYPIKAAQQFLLLSYRLYKNAFIMKWWLKGGGMHKGDITYIQFNCRRAIFDFLKESGIIKLKSIVASSHKRFFLKRSFGFFRNK